MQELVRTTRSRLEAKCGVKLDVEHRIWPWLAKMVGWMMSRADVGVDGKTGKVSTRGSPGWRKRRGGGPLRKLSCM